MSVDPNTAAKSPGGEEFRFYALGLGIGALGLGFGALGLRFWSPWVRVWSPGVRVESL
jgi:hypothetical protein